MMHSGTESVIPDFKEQDIDLFRFQPQQGELLGIKGRLRSQSFSGQMMTGGRLYWSHLTAPSSPLISCGCYSVVMDLMSLLRLSGV